MNTNCLKDVMCPQCGNTDHFKIRCCVWVEAEDKGTDQMLPNQDLEWDEQSFIDCDECSHVGKVGEFVHPGFYITYQKVTEESAEQGEADSSGWWEPGGWVLTVDDKPDPPAYSFDPDDFDEEEHDTLEDAIVEWAVNLLRDQGATHFSGNDWWDTEPEQDTHDGSHLTFSFHPQGLDDVIERINKEL